MKQLSVVLRDGFVEIKLDCRGFFVTNPQSEKMNKNPEFMRKNHYLGFLLTTHFAKKIRNHLNRILSVSETPKNVLL